jgi:hypothetical protein
LRLQTSSEKSLDDDRNDVGAPRSVARLGGCNTEHRDAQCGPVRLPVDEDELVVSPMARIF